MVFLLQISTSFGVEPTQIFVQVSKKVIPSVVNIYTTSIVKSPWQAYEGGPHDMWRHFFGEDFFGSPFGDDSHDYRQQPRAVPKRPQQKATSLGSGFIIETSSLGGLILTNHHVIANADEIKVHFTEEVDEKETPAEIIGLDPDLDIALLKVQTKRKIEALPLGDSDKLEVGEWIAAIGNPFGHGHTVTKGIVSAKERSLPGGFGKYLQVDAPINPGNSGGPLVNLKAEVVGINNAIDARGPGIGFAIPINSIKTLLPQLKTKGKIERGYIGISVGELNEELALALKLKSDLKAPIITQVVPGKPAHRAGLQAYDVVTAVNGGPVRNPNDLILTITNIPIGKIASIKIIRQGKEKNFEVKVEKRPDYQSEHQPQHQQRRRGFGR